MSIRPRTTVSGFLTVALAIGLTPVLAQTPEGVSPGAVDRIVEVEGRCPSFYWSSVPGATAYELVVYRLPDESPASDAVGIELSPSDLALRARVPGGATAWQPSLADGLEPGANHVWFVRAVFREEAGKVVDAGDWSAGRFFAVSPAPSPQEIEQALEVLRRAADPGGAGAAALEEPPPDALGGVSTRSTTARRAVPPGGNLKSVPTATAAIKGSVPDTTGEVYGVVGISASPDGAGVAAANSGGGPDLVLDGSLDGFADARLTEQGIDRPSPGARTFFLTNSIGGTLNLSVDGEVSAVSLVGDGAGLTGVDADTLDGTNGADYATDAEAAGLVAVHAASADHDGRYYTKTQLNTSGGGGAVNWNNLTAVPAGFADGVDDETTYSTGPGLIIDGDQIRIDWGLFHTRTSALDSVGNVGHFTSIAIGADGLGLISYYDVGNSNLKVAHCNDTVCSSASLATLDSADNVGRFTSIAIGADGLGLISYYDETNRDLKIAHCNDTVCSTAKISTLDSAGEVGWYTSIAIGADGLGLISYYDVGNSNLKVAHCIDVACSNAAIATIDSAEEVGRYTSIAIGADGLGLISYYDVGNSNLKVAHCHVTVCSSASLATLDSVDNVGPYTSTIAIGTDGLGLISYYDYTTQDLKVAHCTITACSGATNATLDSTGDVGRYTSIAIGVGGLGLISYFDSTNGHLKVAHLGIGVP